MRAAHQLLRDATCEAHERLDALFMSFDLTTADGYRRFIGAQTDAMLAVERALDEAGAAAVIDDWPERRRSDLLLADATALGLDPARPAPFSLSGEAAVAGALYVVEGSRHGARHLRKLVPSNATSSFLDTDQAKGNWAKLLDRIDAILYQPDARAAAIAAALAVFDVFEKSGREWMTKA